jgi:hypothetical protein
MKKYLLGLVLMGAMICGTSTVVASNQAKKPVKAEQTATVKKNTTAKTCKCTKKCDKKCDKKCTAKCAKPAPKGEVKPAAPKPAPKKAAPAPKKMNK